MSGKCCEDDLFDMIPVLIQVRLILYYPVSALVTLFANILQNPNDARARSDVKLMNVVVNFLSTLVSDESNGSIKRMLGLCGEFERIAQVVLDKAERDSHSKKKRKTAPEETRNLPQGTPEENPTPSPSTTKPPDPPPATVPFPPSVYPDGLRSDGPNMSNHARPFSPDQTVPVTSGLADNIMSGMGQDFPDMLSPHTMGFGHATPFPSTDSPLTSFQQPFVPQDLWQMPMTIEWDWADMSSNFPVFGTEAPPQNGP